MLIAGSLAVLYLVWSGIQYIMSGGDSKKAEAGKTGVKNAVIGIAIIMASGAIIGLGAAVGNAIKGVIN